MADTETPSAKPLRPTRRAPEARPPTPPGPVAGHPIGPVARKPQEELPPGIPPHMASVVRPAGIGARSVAPSPRRALKPSFAVLDDSVRANRVAVEQLRSAAQSAAVQLDNLLGNLKAHLAKVLASKEASAVAAADGLDLDLLQQFADSLGQAAALTGAEVSPEASEGA